MRQNIRGNNGGKPGLGGKRKRRKFKGPFPAMCLLGERVERDKSKIVVN